jgi:nucleoid-associated protein YgaU
MSRRTDKYGLAALIVIGVWVLYYWLRPTPMAAPDAVMLSLDGEPPKPLVDLTPSSEAKTSSEIKPDRDAPKTVGVPAAAPEPAESAAPPAPIPTEYMAQAGDTLTGISQRIYGRAADWVHIYNANRTLLNKPEDLRPGMRLIIPPLNPTKATDAGARP